MPSRTSWLQPFLLLPTLLSSPSFLPPTTATKIDHTHDTDDNLFHFITRPDLKPPKWSLNTTSPAAISPGYWFLAPFEHIDQKLPGNGYVGPHIYDSRGELVWSGFEVTKGWDAIDFRVSRVRGRDSLTWLVQRSGEGFVMDETYQIRKKVGVGRLGRDFNSHEFFFWEEGGRVVVLFEWRRGTTLGLNLGEEGDKECMVVFNGFKVLDAETWEQVFNWTSEGRVGLEESSKLDGGVQRECGNGWGWDYFHANSVDRDHNGDFYVSARYTDTIYKVSKEDGRVVWRLHGLDGQRNDFEMGRGVNFARQHNVRFRGFNGTHEIISLLDNANGQDSRPPTAPNSRGLILALEIDVDTSSDPGGKRNRASLLSSIPHPDGPTHYAPRRGNFQILDNANTEINPNTGKNNDHENNPNGNSNFNKNNIFIGWSEQALHSEHTADGRLIMSARLKTDWLGTYRSYKFPWRGVPREAPRVVSWVVDAFSFSSSENEGGEGGDEGEDRGGEGKGKVRTVIHVSQNGATEIREWRVFECGGAAEMGLEGSERVLIAEKKKTGFETRLVWEGFAKFVVVEGVDWEGRVIARSEVTETEMKMEMGWEDVAEDIAKDVADDGHEKEDGGIIAAGDGDEDVDEEIQSLREGGGELDGKFDPQGQDQDHENGKIHPAASSSSSPSSSSPLPTLYIPATLILSLLILLLLRRQNLGRISFGLLRRNRYMRIPQAQDQGLEEQGEVEGEDEVRETHTQTKIARKGKGHFVTSSRDLGISVDGVGFRGVVGE